MSPLTVWAWVGFTPMISDLVGKVPILVSLPLIATVVTVSILAPLWKIRRGARCAGGPGECVRRKPRGAYPPPRRALPTLYRRRKDPFAYDG